MLLRADALARWLGCTPGTATAVPPRPAEARRRPDLVLRSAPSFGIKDQRLRAIIAEAIHSGDPSKAGFLRHSRRPDVRVAQAGEDGQGDLGGVTQPALILHPRQDDRASLRNAHYLRRIRWTSRDRHPRGQLSRHYARPAARRRAGENSGLCAKRWRAVPSASALPGARAPPDSGCIMRGLQVIY